MLKERIKYTDYDGNEREEDFFFNLTKAEVLEMQLEVSGGYSSYIKRIIEAQNVPELISLFKKLILKSYGVKSDDGRLFIKTEALTAEFTQTEAYSNFFTELAMNADKAEKFVKGILPKDMQGE